MHEHLPDDRTATPVVAERIETLAAWLGELDTRVRAAELTSGDEKTAKELRKAVEAIAKHDPKFQEKVQNHVDVLTDRVATLAGTVATATATLAGKEGDIAGLRRDLGEVNARIEALASTVRTPMPTGELDEIRRALGQLTTEREASVPDKRFAKLEDKVELLTQRLDTVSATVSTATAGLAGREGEVAALHRRFDQDGARLSAAVAELRQTIDPALVLELRSAVESLARHVSAAQEETRSKLVALGVDVDGIVSRMGEADASVAAVRQLVEQDGEALALVGGRLDHAGEEFARVAARVEALDEALGELGSAHAREHSEGAALVARFESGSDKVEALVRELQEALDTMPAGPGPELAEKVETVSEELATLTAEVGSLATTDEAVRTAAADAAQTRALVHGLQARMASQERDLAGLAGRLESGGAAVDALARELREALDTMPRGVDPVLVEAIEVQEGRLTAVTAEVSRLATALEAGRAAAADDSERLQALAHDLRARVVSNENVLAALQATSSDQALAEKVEAVAGQLAALAAEVGSLASSGEAVRVAVAADAEQARTLVEELDTRMAASEHEIELLGTRIETGSTKVEVLVRDLREALDTIPTGPDPSIVGTLEEQAQTIAALATEVDRIAAAGTASQVAAAEGSKQLRTLVEELGTRLSSELDLAAFASRDVAARQDELTGRLGTLERRNAEQANSLEPLVGAGRLQVELQALALRVEHTEVAARESRDTVLAQLELLASRIESRLYRLESEPEDAQSPLAVTDGQVIAIRSGEA